MLDKLVSYIEGIGRQEIRLQAGENVRGRGDGPGDTVRPRITPDDGSWALFFWKVMGPTL